VEREIVLEIVLEDALAPEAIRSISPPAANPAQNLVPDARTAADGGDSALRPPRPPSSIAGAFERVPADVDSIRADLSEGRLVDAARYTHLADSFCLSGQEYRMAPKPPPRVAVAHPPDEDAGGGRVSGGRRGGGKDRGFSDEDRAYYRGHILSYFPL
jgi:hypothetical protein